MMRQVNASAFVLPARKYRVPVDLLRALAWVESRWQVDAHSPVGAVGVMQLMPSTAAGLGVDPYDVLQNLDGGAKYFAKLRRQFPGKWAIAAYNRGQGWARQAMAQGTPWPPALERYVSLVVAARSGRPWKGAAQPAGPSMPAVPDTMPRSVDGMGMLMVLLASYLTLRGF